MALLKRQLHLWHRWLGIVTGLLVLLWFGSGIVMMYVPYPSLTEAERMARLAALDPAAVRFNAAQAWAATGLQGMPKAVRLNAVTGRPAYHFLAEGRWTSVWADSGAPLRVDAALAATAATVTATATAATTVATATTATGIDTATPTAITIAAATAAAMPTVEAIEAIDGDQWTFGPLNPHKPLYRATLNDAEGTVLYISGRTGELVRDTTRNERAWNWAGSVIHWVYFTPLRSNGEAWRQVVMWTSGLAFILAASGMALGILRLRLRRRYSGGRLSPYRGWTGWHHWLGLGMGVLTLTWLFSGWLSVTPFGMFSSPGLSEKEKLAFAGGALGASDLAVPLAALLQTRRGNDGQADEVLEAEWRRIDGKLYLDTLGRTGRTLLDAQDGKAVPTLPVEVLLHAVQAMRPLVPLQPAMLASADDYYYSHHRQASFPVLRARFLTPEEATVYVDAKSGKIVEYVDVHNKWNRWLFNALHQADLPLLRTRPWWDVLVIMLCMLGAMLATTGLVLGWRRLRKSVPR